MDEELDFCEKNHCRDHSSSVKFNFEVREETRLKGLKAIDLCRNWLKTYKR